MYVKIIPLESRFIFSSLDMVSYLVAMLQSHYPRAMLSCWVASVEKNIISTLCTQMVLYGEIFSNMTLFITIEHTHVKYPQFYYVH